MQGEFAAILGVKDERELLPHCMAQLRRIGVGRVFAIDCGSSDGSLEWLQAHAGEDLQVHQFSDQDPDAAGWDRLNTRLARESQAEWVLFLDADEFWIPAGGHLRHCAALADSDVLRVHRFNVPLGPHGAWLGEGPVPGDPASLSLIVQAIPDFRNRLSSDTSLPWIRGVPVPKIMTRADRIAGMADGGHDLRAAGEQPLREHVPADLLIAHLPFTTPGRFERKLENIRRVFQVHDAYFGANLAWHWRRWLELPDAASVRREFERQAFDQEAMARFRNEGVVATATEWFAREQARAPA